MNDLKYFNNIIEILNKYKYFMDKVDYNLIDKYIKLWFLELDGNNIKFIDNPNSEMCINAIKKNPESLMWIKNPTEQMVLESINISPVCIQLSDKLYINCVYRALEIDKSIITVLQDMANIYKNAQKEKYKILYNILKEYNI